MECQMLAQLAFNVLAQDLAFVFIGLPNQIDLPGQTAALQVVVRQLVCRSVACFRITT